MPFLEQPAQLEYLDSFRFMVGETALAAGLTERDLGLLEMALEEVLVNIVNYAYPQGQAGTIRLKCEADGQGEGILHLEVRDSGAPFDPLAKTDPDLTLGVDERDIGGLGIFMTKKVMKDVRYERQGEENVLLLVYKSAE